MGKSEARVQQDAQVAASRAGARLWRNNSGSTPPCEHCGRKPIRPVRYGLCNVSKKVNTEIKSSDLVGITPVLITPDMVGQTLGVFTAVECKPEGWVFGKDPKREIPQQRFINLVNSLGGRAKFYTGVE